MGSTHLCLTTMKSLIALSCLVAFAAAATDCDLCIAIVDVISEHAVSDESIERQIEILVGGLCPTVDNSVECDEKLPEFWRAIAKILWPGYYDPTADWMCGPTCYDPTESEMTCDDSKGGIQASIDQLLSDEAIDAIVSALSGDAFCGQVDDPSGECPAAVDFVIRNGLPLLAAATDESSFAEACNGAVPGTCPAKIF